jgi:8-oxo-dGTP pyrophosphatase MutT (NUDIX family)
MYKVFFNENCLSIGSKADFPEGYQHLSEQEFEEHLLTYLTDLFKERDQLIHVNTNESDKVWKSVCSQFHLIEAAGGYVKNEFGEILCIHRLGKWDLPKGKLEEGEEIEECAIREVEEECGIENLKITSSVFHTYHTYMLKNKPILKRTYWYAMNTTKQNLTPQTEEDISEVIWAKPIDMPKILNDTYPNIKLVLENFSQ